MGEKAKKRLRRGKRLPLKRYISVPMPFRDDGRFSQAEPKNDGRPMSFQDIAGSIEREAGNEGHRTVEGTNAQMTM